MRLLFARKIRGIDDHVHKKLRVIRRRKSTEGYEIVVGGTRKLLRRSRLSADLVSGNPSRLTGSFLIVNGHGGNVSIIEQFGRDLRREKGVMVGKFDIWQVLTPEMKKELFGENVTKCMGHGAEPVTSVMKYLVPDDIRMELVEEDDRVHQWQDFELTTIGKTKVAGVEASIYFNMIDATKQGCLADPHYGSAEIGEKIFERMVEVGCEFVTKIQNSQMKI